MNPSSAPPPLPPPGQQVIHVTQDLDTDLEALFNSVMNPKPSSWRKKILPESFFKEGDSTGEALGKLQVPGQHLRSYSSPGWGHLGLAARREGPASPNCFAITDADDADNLKVANCFPSFSHTEKITTWQDPRKAMSQPLNHMSLRPAVTSTPVPQSSMAASQPNLVMSHQHQQQMVPSTLSQQNRPSQNPAGIMSLPTALPTALTTQQQQQQKLRLQRIQMERERIRVREAIREEAALCRQLPMEAETMAAVQAAANPPAMTPDMRSITNNSSDPFLNGGPYHSREQSTDSGLGLGCYSVPTTPEDFLSNVDEMDTGETTGQTPMNINPQQTRFPDFLDCLPGTNVDLGTLESEDLIPLFNDVESALNKSEPFLTWL
uniref:WW domain containing transcription regulator 1 n=1 Tax=Spermophilus dauricus TaxID=99837 RepID=A0A8C9QI81_SPEDA